MQSERFWLKADFNEEWTEVTKEAWIKAERAAGFRPKLGSGDPNYMKVCATGGFGGASISGRITRGDRLRAAVVERAAPPVAEASGESCNCPASPGEDCPFTIEQCRERAQGAPQPTTDHTELTEPLTGDTKIIDRNTGRIVETRYATDHTEHRRR